MNNERNLSTYDDGDCALAEMLPFAHLCETAIPEKSADVRRVAISLPDGEYGFLHEAAIISFHGALYASWYNCPQSELHGKTPIRGAVSRDGGATWSRASVIAQDERDGILYCPPVYGVQDDKLYMFVNQMVGPDLMHALDLYVLDEKTGAFRRLWSRQSAFKLNTNVVPLDNGKLLLPGRTGEIDGLPETPAVLISDSGKIDGEWREVPLAPDASLPDGKKYIFPEMCVLADGARIWAFCRDDERRVPLMYTSEDYGEHWSPLSAHDLPFGASKICSGTLSCGRDYLIANLDLPDKSREKLVLFSAPHGSMRFDRALVLADGEETGFPGAKWWHYPLATEADGYLHVICTVSFDPPSVRGAALLSIPVSEI